MIRVRHESPRTRARAVRRWMEPRAGAVGVEFRADAPGAEVFR